MGKHASNYFSVQSLTPYVNQRLTGTSGLVMALRGISLPEIPTLVLGGSDSSPETADHGVDSVVLNPSLRLMLLRGSHLCYRDVAIFCVAAPSPGCTAAGSLTS